MKKFLSALFAICMLSGLAACSPPGVAGSSEPKQQDTESDTDTASDTYSWSYTSSKGTNAVGSNQTDAYEGWGNSRATESSDLSDEDVIPENASEFAVELYNKYVDLSEKNGFEVSNVTYSNQFTEFSLVFEGFKNDVSFYEDKKSFKVFINNDSAAKSQIKEVMAKVLMGIDDITADEAKKISQSIANSYSSDTFSDTQEIGDYLVILLPDESKYSNPFKYLKCIHKDELWEQVNKDEYPPIDRAMYEAPELNTGEKCKITGTVKEWHLDCFYDTLYKGVTNIETDNGDEYCCEYLYEYAPVALDEGTIYTIYGTIENGYISVQYPEKLN